MRDIDASRVPRAISNEAVRAMADRAWADAYQALARADQARRSTGWWPTAPTEMAPPC